MLPVETTCACTTLRMATRSVSIHDLLADLRRLLEGSELLNSV